MACNVCPMIAVAAAGSMIALAGLGFAQPAGGGAAIADSAAKQPDAAKAADALEPFRKLAGAWHGMGKEGDPVQEVHVTYKVTSGGSAVVETLFPGTPHEMVTVYFLDGGEVCMTHYCMLGNQPTMQGTWTMDGKTCDFALRSVTNCDARTGTCMGKAQFSFTDADHITTKWYTLVKGVASEHVEFALTRKK